MNRVDKLLVTAALALLPTLAGCSGGSGQLDAACTRGALCDPDTSRPPDDGPPAVEASTAPRDLAPTAPADGSLAADRGVADGPAVPYVHEDVSPATVKSWVDAGKEMTLLDVREASEYAQGHLAGAVNLAWTSGELKQKHGTLPRDRPLVVYCRSGSRSQQAATFLAAQGFEPVHDMGGIMAWTAAGYPVVP